MSRNYIGLSCSGHDNALAIVDSGGRIIFAEAAERYLQNKRGLDAPPDDMFRIGQLIETYCEPDADLVLCKTWSENAARLTDKSVSDARASLFELDRLGAPNVSDRIGDAFNVFRDRNYAFLQLADMCAHAKSVAGRNIKHFYRTRCVDERSYNHHLTHAATACFTSPFNNATCVIVDGIGEGTTASCYRYDDGRLELMRDESDPACDPLAGLGLFYGDLCNLCGFDPFKGEEWKVMGLAPYGIHDERLYRNFKQCLELRKFAFRRSSGEATALARLVRHARQTTNDRQLIANLAYAGQRVFEDVLIELCRTARHHGTSQNLALGGGCALNSSANGKLLAATGFKRLYVPCAPADDGNAVGAALLGYYQDNPIGRPTGVYQSPYLGSSVSLETVERIATSGAFQRVERLESEDLCRFVAERLRCGELVGWMQGRAEFGPRALGNRSILADPRDGDAKDRINQAVKFRESFRPFAPAILAEHGPEWFEEYEDSPYMERTLRWRPEVRDRVPAVVHVDGTGRLQTVRREWNPTFHQLLSAFHERSGIPVLLNTSFNVMGKPIVHSVEDAVAVFATSRLDALAIDSYLFAKR